MDVNVPRIHTYAVHIEPAEEGGFVVSVPALPGCVTQGETYEEALAMAQDCIEGFLEALVKAGEPIPEKSTPTMPIDVCLAVRVPSQV